MHREVHTIITNAVASVIEDLDEPEPEDFADAILSWLKDQGYKIVLEDE
jgi:hypothetical protein